MLLPFFIVIITLTLRVNVITSKAIYAMLIADSHVRYIIFQSHTNSSRMLITLYYQRLSISSGITGISMLKHCYCQLIGINSDCW